MSTNNDNSSISVVQANMERKENEIFRQLFATVQNEHNFFKAKDAVGSYIGKLETLFTIGMVDENDISIPKYALKKFLLGVKGVVEQYVTSKSEGKEACADSILEAIWQLIQAFEKDKTIPPNIYDVIQEYMTKISILEDRNNELSRENAGLETKVSTLENNNHS